MQYNSYFNYNTRVVRDMLTIIILSWKIAAVQSVGFKYTTDVLPLVSICFVTLYRVCVFNSGFFPPTAFPEGTSGCLRSTRRPCTSDTQTSALRGRIISPCLSIGKSAP